MEAQGRKGKKQMIISQRALANRKANSKEREVDSSLDQAIKTSSTPEPLSIEK